MEQVSIEQIFKIDGNTLLVSDSEISTKFSFLIFRHVPYKHFSYLSPHFLR